LQVKRKLRCLSPDHYPRVPEGRTIPRVKLLLGLVLLVPLAASATIYKWLDEEGRVVYANHAPDATARNVQEVKFDEPPAAAAPTPSALEQRVASLERQLQAAQQYVPPAPIPPMPYPAAMPPQPTMSDYYQPTYGYGYPGYGYPMYGYPVYTYPVYGYRYPYNRYPPRVMHHGSGSGFVRGAAHVAPHAGGMGRR
jgi:uncharacterized protein DUF4124